MALNRILLVLVVVLNLFLLGRLVFSDQGLFAYLDLKGRYEELEKRIEGLDRRNLELSREIRLLKSDKAYLEKMIRQKMHFVREDEILYVFPEDESDAGPEGYGNDGKDGSSGGGHNAETEGASEGEPDGTVNGGDPERVGGSDTAGRKASGDSRQ